MFNQHHQNGNQRKLQNLEEERNRLQQFVQAIREHNHFKDELLRRIHNQGPVHEDANNRTNAI